MRNRRISIYKSYKRIQLRNGTDDGDLRSTDVVALASQYAVDLSDEEWVKECVNQTTQVDGKIYSFPFCVEGRGIIYNKSAIEDTLGEEFDPSPSIPTMH